jgi:acid phosphatase type 7
MWVKVTPTHMFKSRLAALAAALASSVLLWNCGGSSPASPSPGGGGGGIGGGNIPPPPPAPVQVLAAGDVGECGFGASETGKLLERLTGTILAVGDLAYYDGSRTNFRDCYDPFWGPFLNRTRPVPGNHEYSVDRNATGFWDYFGDMAGPRGLGYYAFTEGAWRIIALNSETSMGAGSPQQVWLRNELTNNRTLCTLAYWHRPLFTSGPNGSNPDVRPLWDTLLEFNVEVVLNGHDHLYERFEKQDASGRLSDTGIRQFTVGTGGAHSYDPRPKHPNQARISKTYGILVLTLDKDSYQWDYATNSSFRDTNSGACR